MRKSFTIGASLLFLFLLAFLPRLFSLSAHWASDETLWMLRSRDFFFALETGNFADTYITNHPGVTTCWLGSVAIWNKYRHDSFPKNWFYSDRFLSPDMLASIRLPIVVMTSVLIFLAGILLYRLFGDWKIGGIGTLFLSVEPFLLAESRRAHTDALTSLFLFLSLLLWLCYLESEAPRRRDIILSGICFAFACLTKSLAGGFLLFLPLLLGWYIQHRGTPWVKCFWSAILWMMTTLLTVLLAWPYLWTATFKLGHLPVFPFLSAGSALLLIWSRRQLSTEMPSMLKLTELLLLGGGLLMIVGGTLSAVKPVITEMYGAFRQPHGLPTLFLGEIRYNPGMLYFPVMWFVWSTPLTLPFIGVAMYRTWQEKNHGKKEFRLVVVFGVFVLFYLIGLSFVAKKISRYIVIFLPAVSLLSTFGALQFAHLLKKKWLQFFFLVAVVFLQITPILRLHPYYRTYYYPLLSGAWVTQNTGCITGVGIDLAAEYLNALPNAQQLRVQVTWFSKDLAHYFVGETSMQHLSRTRPCDYEVEYLYDIQIQRALVASLSSEKKQTISSEKTRELEHVVRLNGMDYIWIYRILPPKE